MEQVRCGAAGSGRHRQRGQHRHHGVHLFPDPVDFGGGPLAGFDFNDMFVAKYDTDGNHIWSRRCGASGWYTQGESIAMDGSGNAIVCGRFGGTVSFGGAPVTQLGNLDVFLVKYAPDGAHQWTKRLGNSSGEYAYLAVDVAGNIVLGGYFETSVSFGGGTLINHGSGDVFVARFNPSGVHQWSYGFGNADLDNPESIAIDGSGRILLVGRSARRSTSAVARSGNHSWFHSIPIVSISGARVSMGVPSRLQRTPRAM